MKKPLEGPKHGKAFRGKSWQLIILFMALTFVSHAQDSAKYSRIQGFGFGYKRFDVDSIFFIPLYSSPHTPYRPGAIKYNPLDSSIYSWTGHQWIRVIGSGGSIDSTTAGSGMFQLAHALGWGGRLFQDATISQANLRSVLFDSATTFKIQNAAGTTYFLFDYSNPLIKLVSGSVFLNLQSNLINLFAINGSALLSTDSFSISHSTLLAINAPLFKIRNIATSGDTTANKPLGIASDGTVKKMTYWPGSGGSVANLDTTRTSTIVTVTNTAGTSAKIPLVDKVNNKAGLMSPGDKQRLDSNSYIRNSDGSGGARIAEAQNDSTIYLRTLGNSSNIAITTTDSTNTPDLTNTGVTANTYGDATHVPQITVDVKGRVSLITPVSIVAGTANIAANAVTNAKMQNGGAFQIPGYDASGHFVQLNIGPGLANDGTTISSTGIPEQTVGQLFSRSGFSSLSFGTTNGSGQTNSVSGNVAILKSDGTVLGGRSFDVDSLINRSGSGFTDMENWIFWVGARVPVKSSVTKLAIGLRSQVGALNNNLIAVYDLSTGGNAGKLLLYTSVNTLVETSTSTVPVSANDSVTLFLQRLEGKIYVWAQNVTTQSNNLTMPPYTFYFLNGGLFNDVPNMGKFAIFNASDSTKIGSINIYSPEEKFPALMCITDSKGYLYSGPYEETWVAQLQHAYGSVVRSGGSSETAGDVLNRVNEIIAIHPKAILLSVGRNGGLSDTTNYIALVSALQAAGITVIHFIEGYDAVWAAGGMSTFISMVYRRYGANNVIDGNTPIQNCPDCIATDNVHYTQHGHDVLYLQVIISPVAYNLIARGTMTRGMTGNVDANALAIGGAAQKSLTSYQAATYSPTNGLYINNKSLFELNQNAATVFKFQNSTDGASSSTQLQVLGDANSMLLWQQHSSSAAYGAATAHASVFYSFGTKMVLMSDNGPMSFTSNGNAEKMQLNNNGALLINTTSQTNSELLRVNGGVKFDLGSDATGDIFYRASTGAFTRLAIGTSGYNLTSSGTLPQWTAPTSTSATPIFSVVTADPSDWTAAVSTLTELPDLTGVANHTVTLPAASSNTGKMIKLWNKNSSGFTWSFAAAITLPSGSTSSTISNNSYTILLSDGSVWLKEN